MTHSAPPTAPLKYHPDLEQAEADEVATADALVTTLLTTEIVALGVGLVVSVLL